jgi:hypothetical protein
MSSIPLSAKDAPPEGTSNYGALAPEDRADAGAAEKLEDYVSGVMDRHYVEEPPAPDKRPLDVQLTENLDRHFEAKEDEADFKEALPAIDELGHRYKDQGQVIDTLKNVVHLIKAAQTDPRGVGLALAESYARLGPWSATDSPTKEMPAVEYDHTGKRQNGKRLDFILEQARERSTSDKELLANTAEIRAELKKLMPGKKFKDAVKTILAFDTEARKTPVESCPQFAATQGMGWSPRQIEAETEQRQADNLVARGAQQLPGFNELKPAMAALIQNRPELFANAPDMETVAAIAYQHAAAQHNHAWERHQLVTDQLNKLAATDYAFAEQIAKTLIEDKNFARFAAGTDDPVQKYYLAMGYVNARAKDNQAAVAKAKRAAPVKSSSGALNPTVSKGGGMDSAISQAMSKYFG